MSGKSLFDNTISFSPVMGKAFGACAALLVQQIHYHCLNRSNLWQGEYWVYNSVKEWADVLMLWDERTVRRALVSLRSLGVLIVAENNKYRYDKTLWYRVDYSRLCEVLGEKFPDWKFSPGLVASNVRIEVAENVLVDTVKMSVPIPKTTTKTSTKTTLENQTPKTSGEEVEEKEMVLPKNGIKTGPTNVAAVLAKSLGSGNAKQTMTMALYKVWASSLPKFHPEVKFVGAFTMKQKAMIARVGVAWGVSSSEVLVFVIEHWVSFGKYLRDTIDLKSCPAIPVLEFLTKYSSEAMNYYIAAKSPKLQTTATPPKKVGDTITSGKITIKKGPPNAPKTETPAPKKPEETPITLAEILAFDPAEYDK